MAMRDQNGHFVKGGPGGPGRPKRQAERAYLRATVSVCKLRDWREIVARAVIEAKAGDGVARRWLSDILVGRDPLGLAALLDEMRNELEAIRNARNQ